MSSQIPKKQHYVPRFILRNFSCSSEKYQVHVYDKQEKQSFLSSVRNAAAQNYFYDLNHEDGRITVEPALAELEGTVAPIVQRVVNGQLPSLLTHEDKVALAHFICVQLVRTDHFRSNMMHMNQEVETWLGEIGIDPETVTNFKSFDDSDLRKATINAVAEAHRFIPFLLDKIWTVHVTEEEHFYIADNPVDLSLGDQAYGPGVGLGVPSVMVQMPLSPSRCLVLYCSTYREKVRALKQQLDKLEEAYPIIPGFSDLVTQIDNLYAAFEKHGSFTAPPDNVLWLNANQVINAERFIYSTHSDFSLLEQILRENPQYRNGPRGELG